MEFEMEKQIPIFAVVTFTIPFGLSWFGDVIVEMNDYLAKVHFSRCYNKNSPFTISGHAELIGDREGVLARCNIKCLMEFVGNNDNVYIARSTEVTNKVLDLYRCQKSNAFWIDKVRTNNFANHKVYYIFPDGRSRANCCVAMSEKAITLSAYPENVPQDIQAMLASCTKYPRWKIALANAKNRFDLEDYEQAIIETNISLENFLYTQMQEKLNMSWDDVEMLLQESPCEKCAYLGENPSPIDNYPMGVYKVAKKLYREYSISELSQTKFDDLVRKINKYRNSIVHGKEDIIITKENAGESIECLEELVRIFLNKIPNATNPSLFTVFNQKRYENFCKMTQIINLNVLEV